MASGDDKAEILANPCDVSWGATAIGSAHPHTGGTGLGLTLGAELIPNLHLLDVPTEERGQRYDTLYMGASPILRITFRQWDDTVLQRAFPGGLSAAGSSERVVKIPGTLKPGTRLTSLAGILILTPTDTTVQKALIAYSAVGVAAGSFWFANGEDLALEVSFLLLRDAANRVVEVSRLNNLTAI